MKPFMLILLGLLINFSRSYSQDFWGKTTAHDTMTTYSLAINSSGYIFAGTDCNGVFRSTDYGENWTNLGIMNYDIYSIAISSSDDIFVATYLWGGIYRSTDNGNTWTNQGLYHFDRSIAINSNGDIFLGTGAVGIWRTTDNGANWIQILFGSNCSEVNSLIINSVGAIFAGTTQGGAFRSTDNGDNWVQIIQGLTELQILSLAINSYGDIFAGTSGGGVFRSTDNGANWIQINQGLTYTQGYFVRSLAINSSGDIFAGTADGVFRSRDNGASWVQVNQGLTNISVYSLVINSNGDVFVGTEGGIFRSTSNLLPISSEIVPPIKYALEQNYPNPFNPSTTIKFAVPNESNVNLSIYNILGEMVTTLVNEEMKPGYYEYEFNVSDLVSGVYIYRITAGDLSAGTGQGFVETKKMVLMK